MTNTIKYTQWRYEAWAQQQKCVISVKSLLLSYLLVVSPFGRNSPVLSFIVHFGWLACEVNFRTSPLIGGYV